MRFLAGKWDQLRGWRDHAVRRTTCARLGIRSRARTHDYLPRRTLAQRALCAAAMRALASGDMVRRALELLRAPMVFALLPPPCAFCRAQRARCAAAIRARASTDMWRAPADDVRPRLTV